MPRGTCENCGSTTRSCMQPHLHSAGTFLFAHGALTSRPNVVKAMTMTMTGMNGTKTRMTGTNTPILLRTNGRVGDAFSRLNATALINGRLRRARSTLRFRKSKP